MIKKSIFFGLIFLILAGFGFYYFLTQTYPETPPLLTAGYYIESMFVPHARLQKDVIGFLPYWQMSEINHIRPQQLSELNFFSLSIGNDGHIAKVVNGETDPGWRSWELQETKNFFVKAHILGAKNAITISALDNDLITSFLDNHVNKENFVNDLVKEIKDRQLDSVNIDFEYTGTPDISYNYAFSNFSKKLKLVLKENYPKIQLNLSLMPLAGRENNLYDFPKLLPYYDHFIGMSYEYYGENADIAGPIAPMHGFRNGNYFFDVETTYEDYLKIIPRNKIIMGVPYYGREWAVQDGKTKNSKTLTSSNPNSYAAILSYARAREDNDIKKNQCSWDPLAQETWCWFYDKKSAVDHQLWVADNKSIQTRFNYANSQNFSGIAIWTLGYDKQYSDLWNMLTDTFDKKD